MLTAKQLWDSGQDIVGIHNLEQEEIVKRILNKWYYKLCEETDWTLLRRSVVLDFTDADEDGKLLPSNLIGITGIVEEDGNIKYYPTQMENKISLDGKPHWYYVPEATTPLFVSSEGIDVTCGSNVVAGIPEDYTGEYVRLGSELGYYRITSFISETGATVITPTYYGPTIKDGSVVVRPPETKKLMIVDADGVFRKTSVRMWYWIYPPPLYRDNDVPLLPSTRALELAMWYDLTLPIEKRATESRHYLELYMAELQDMINKNPHFQLPILPRDRTGRVIRFGRRR